MHLKDEEKTSFITKDDTFCYTQIPFNLKNVSATYQRLVNRMFEDQLEKNIEVYMDDMVIKSVQLVDHIKDSKQMFNVIRNYGIRFHHTKCVFGVTIEKFIGYLISARGSRKIQIRYKL